MKFFLMLGLVASLHLACSGKKETTAETKNSDTVAAIGNNPIITAPEKPTLAKEKAPEDTPLESPDNFVLVPGQQVGMVRDNASEAQLVQLLGQENVNHEAISLGEGDSELGTILFKGTPNEAQILWKDKKNFAQPEAVILRPGTDKPGTDGNQTQWITPKGLTIGSTLKQVEQLNGKAFMLYGFGWDMGGNVSNWQGGKLQAADGKTYMSVTFGFTDLTPVQEKLAAQVMGDSEFSSRDAALQKLNPKVQTITLRFK